MSKPLVWEGSFKLSVDDFVIKNPNLWGINAQISKFKIGIQEIRLVYNEEKGQYAAEFKGLLDALGIIKSLYDFFATSTDATKKYMFYADAVVDKFRVYEDGTIDLKAEVGIGLPQLKIGPLVSQVAPVSRNQTGGVEGRLKINTIDDLYSVYFGMSLPDMQKFTTSGGTEYFREGGIKANAGIFLVRLPVGFIPFPDTIILEYQDNVGFIQIPGVPVAINQLGGGIYNLHTLRDAVKKGKYPDFSGNFIFGLTDTVSPVIAGNRMLSIKDATISVGSTKMTLSGDLYFYVIKLLSAESGLLFYPVTGVYIKGSVNFIDVIILESYAAATYDHETQTPYIGGYGYGRLQIPNWSPIAPGKLLGEAKAEINTVYAEAYARWGLITVGARYYWRTGQIKLAQAPEDMPVLTIEHTNEDGITEVLELGTNLYPIHLRAVDEGEEGIYLASITGVNNHVYQFDSDGKDSLVIQARYDYASQIELEITDPYGNEYPLIFDGEAANVDTSVYIPEDGTEDDKKNYIAVFVPAEKNIPGTWNVRSNIEAEIEVYGAKEIVEIESVEVEEGDEDNKYDIYFKVNGFDKEAIYTADLYLEAVTTEGQGISTSTSKEEAEEEPADIVIRIAEDVEVEDDIAHIQAELPESVPNGDYKIVVALREYSQNSNPGYIVLSQENRVRTNSIDKENLSAYTYGKSDVITVENKNIPTAPQGVSAESIGNSTIRVRWQAVNEKEMDITGYYVVIADKDGQEQERHFVAAEEGLKDYEREIPIRWLDEETSPKDILVSLCAVSEKTAADDDTEYIDAELIDYMYQGEDRHIVRWKAIDGITNYMIIFKHPNVDEEYIFYYYDSSQGQDSELEAFIGSLPFVIYIDFITVKGIKQKDWSAPNVEVADESDGSKKKIAWDKVDGNIESYTIAAIPIGEDDTADTIVYQYTDVPEPQPSRYSVTIEGFKPEVNYEVVVQANEFKEKPRIFLGDMSETVAVKVPVPEPPNVDVILQPADMSSSGTIRIDFDEEGTPYFRANIKDITMTFVSDTAVRSEISLNPTSYFNVDPIEKNGASWSTELNLEEGLNLVNIRSWNEKGDLREEDVMIYVKTALPGLLLDDVQFENGKVKVSGITDRVFEDLGSEAGIRAYVNGVEVEVDEDGRFEYEFEIPDTALIEFTIYLVDSFGNETIHVERVVNASLGRVDGIYIDINEELQPGYIPKLRAVAYELGEQGNPVNEFELPNELIEWKIIQGHENAGIVDNRLEIIQPGQVVLYAGYKVSKDFSWEDYVLINIMAREDDEIAQEEAYLTGIEISYGKLSPEFSRDIYSYSLTVPYNLGSIWIKPIADIEGAVITVNGEQIKAGEKTPQIPLNTGKNTITITVSALGMLEKEYTVEIYRKRESGKPTETGSPTPSTDYSHDEKQEGLRYTRYGIIVEVPPGAFDQAFKISIERINSTAKIPMPEGKKLIGDIFEISKDKGGYLKKAASISFSFQLSQVDLDKEDIALYLLDEGKGQWIRLDNIEVDGRGGRVKGEAYRFGKFALFTTPKEREQESDILLTDISGHWAEKDILDLVKAGIITGYPDRSFRPETNISRAEFVTMLAKALNLKGTSQKFFKDTQNHWAREAIATAYANRIIQGYNEDYFGPDDPITREQMAAILVRTLKIKQSKATVNFADAAEISPWALDSVMTAAKEGIFKGYRDNTFRPKANSTRAEAATVICRILTSR